MKRIAVVGAGTMGHGIAQIAALAEYDVALTDTNAQALPAAIGRIRANLDGGVKRGKVTAEAARAALERVHPVGSLEEAAKDTDLVIEAVVEDLDAKRDLFRALAAFAKPAAILATNTSSLSVTRIAESVDRPERMLGMHFFNPVHIMRLVELVAHPGTAPETLTVAREAVLRMKKEPIVVKDTPGFASSRLGVTLGLEAMRMVEDGVASPEDIDTAMVLGYGHPMGPLRVSDLVGLDVRLAIAEYLYRELGDERYRPPDILRRKVAAGELGKKSGRGFYQWEQTPSS